MILISSISEQQLFAARILGHIYESLGASPYLSPSSYSLSINRVLQGFIGCGNVSQRLEVWENTDPIIKVEKRKYFIFM